MLLSVGFIARECFNANRMDAVEDTLFDIGVDLLQILQQLLDFLAFAVAGTIVVHHRV